MREYEPKYPLEVLDTFSYPNLLKDRNNKVISKNITWLTLRKTEDLDKLLKEMELKVKQNCQNAEIAYYDFSGNRWIFLILSGKQSENRLKRMQKVYKKLYKRMSVHMW